MQSSTPDLAQEGNKKKRGRERGVKLGIAEENKDYRRKKRTNVRKDTSSSTDPSSDPADDTSALTLSSRSSSSSSSKKGSKSPARVIINSKKKEKDPGLMHKLPADLLKALSSPAGKAAWEDITPLARNEWICWVTSAKQAETRKQRIQRTHDDLIKGKRRPCCWPGCSHRYQENL